MPIEPDYRKLNDLIDEFEKLDSELVSEILSGNDNHIEKVFSAKREIKVYISNHSVLSATGFLADKIKKIRDDYGYNIDQLFAYLNESSEDKISSAQENIDPVEALYGEGTDRYVGVDFLRRRNELGAIVATQKLPAHAIANLERIKECYALGLFEAAVIYCRALIEAAGYDFLIRRKIVDDRATPIEKYKLSALMRNYRNRIDDFVYNETMKVIYKANDLLHDKGDKGEQNLSEEQALDSIQSTIAFVEYVYQ